MLPRIYYTETAEELGARMKTIYDADAATRVVEWKRCPTTYPEEHGLGDFPMSCRSCHEHADS